MNNDEFSNQFVFQRVMRNFCGGIKMNRREIELKIELNEEKICEIEEEIHTKQDEIIALQLKQTQYEELNIELDNERYNFDDSDEQYERQRDDAI